MTPEAYLDALLSLPEMWGTMVSPNGAWVAWTWHRAGPTAEVYAAPTDGSSRPQRLSDSGQDTMLVAWTPDSRAVIVKQDTDGNERYGLYRIDLERPLHMQSLTDPMPDYFLRGGHLHPDGRWLVYGMNYDVERDAEIEQTWIYRHDLETGERLPLARPAKAAYTTPRLNATGTHILYARMDRHPAGYQMWLVDIAGDSDREILNVGDDKKVFGSWFPDGERVLVKAETQTHTRLGIWQNDVIRWVLDDPERNIENAYVPHGSDQIVVVEVRDARTQCSLLDPVTGSERHLPPCPGNLVLHAPVGDGDWTALYYSAQQPEDVVRLSLEMDDPAQFTSLARVWERTTLSHTDLTPAEDFRWTSVDGLAVQGWLFRAKEMARGTVVYVHGGPTAHTKDTIYPAIQYYVRQGFHVLAPNYRGSTGFGLPYRELIRQTGWGGLEQDDIQTGIEALIAAGIAERGKIGITGTSYGGYSSWCGITRCEPDILAAAAPICGMTDLVVDYHTTRPDLRPYSEEMLGGSPDQVPERYHERSPINYVENIQGRLLIVQGLQDPNVTPDNVRVVTEALQNAGVEYELLAFEDEGHGVYRPANQKKLYQTLHQFFESAFNGR